jgi:O-antigen ligase
MSFSRGKLLWALVSAFSLIIVLSSITAVYPDYALENAFIWINWVIVIILIGATVRTPSELVLLFGAFCLWNLKMSQHAVRSWAMAGFQFRNWGVTGAPGWFQNSGEFGIEMCIFVPISVALIASIWRNLSQLHRLLLLLVPFSAVVGVVGSSSRGALLGLAAVGAWAVLVSPYRIRIGSMVAVAATIAWLLLPQESKLRWETAGEDQTSLNRIAYWKHGIEIAQQHPLLGIGYQNWLPYYRSRYNASGELPHNYFIECASQLGFLGLVVFCGILVAFFALNASTRRLVRDQTSDGDRMLWFMSYGLDGSMVGFLASGFFVSVLWYPFIWVNIGFSLAVASLAGASTRRRRLNLGSSGFRQLRTYTVRANGARVPMSPHARERLV